MDSSRFYRAFEGPPSSWYDFMQPPSNRKDRKKCDCEVCKREEELKRKEEKLWKEEKEKWERERSERMERLEREERERKERLKRERLLNRRPYYLQNSDQFKL